MFLPLQIQDTKKLKKCPTATVSSFLHLFCLASWNCMLLVAKDRADIQVTEEVLEHLSNVNQYSSMLTGDLCFCCLVSTPVMSHCPVMVACNIPMNHWIFRWMILNCLQVQWQFFFLHYLTHEPKANPQFLIWNYYFLIKFRGTNGD